ncbi:diaminopimelate decarboxylase [Dysgonomonas sp. PFB1-18]|uniref:diaminopimelate decarboxylase n=1 Tax=unclassified Dysgonomonas TaxID=2630389 RepID=UPI0024745182|nr:MULTISPECIES: diaminopimelate decarboxylase [unclassified Dysgonomonas]MDH6310505.1 diaminopimelate decarboxylase [Dysgonomonas sp. PF1-14]MDH6340355.1 diaminopimelate decarboxylase [Dysgonomonas sp. PF1-16]MDH6382065.1 diaminopimelate decarboxylase [Dysgonomonas sp. PFB1-18]MDH6399326.1 diaminopimelate decarboxylase [Dysgonomonas sp. PF1-23]
MTKGNFPVDKLKGIDTPFYYYDIDLLKRTLKIVKEETKKYGFIQHYAVKANANRRILELIASEGFGADCVSGNEVKAAVNAGFPASKIVFAGVGKTDKEINMALDLNIFCFNVESLPELEVINELANKKGKLAQVALRVNPDVDAHTHEYITTGLNENKFGFSMAHLENVVEKLQALKSIKLIGLHFHIGSQIEDVHIFEPLCERVNELQNTFEKMDVKLEHINLGGGLGIDYENPDANPVPDFAAYFELFAKHLKLRDNQQVHFELGRAIVGQCGALFTRTVYVKHGESKTFVIVDAGMTDLIRPALYQAYHKVENISSDQPAEKYDVVGPICESSDVFVKDYELNGTSRGDLLVLRSAGAYGEIMASQYNCRELPKAYYSDKI